MRVGRLAGVAAVCAGVAAAAPAQAQLTFKDTQIIARTLTFLEAPPSGTAELGVVFDASVVGSLPAARQAAAQFGGGVAVGHLTLEARVLPLSELGAAQNLVAILVPFDLGDTGGALAAAARRLHVPVISTSMACVERGDCTVGFRTQDTLQIVLNHAACEAAQIGFIQAFRILVKEI